jgi:hypothetical protein
MVCLRVALLLSALRLAPAADDDDAPPPSEYVRSAINFDGSSAWKTALPKKGGGGGGGSGGGGGGSGGSGSGGAFALSAPAAPVPHILPAGRVLQLPSAVDARSMSLGAHRGVVYVTDGALHNVEHVPWWCLWCSAPASPFPYGYLIRPDGDLALKLLFRERTLQPYGVAEADDGALAVTFYQGPMLEVWEPNLAMAWNYHELSEHPSLPFFLPRQLTTALGYPLNTLAVPYDIMDVMNDKGPAAVQVRFSPVLARARRRR